MGFWEGLGEGAGGRWPKGPGGQALTAFFSGGVVEPAFARVRPTGFEWWAGPHAQRVGVTPEQTLEGLVLSRVLVEIDVAQGLPDTDEAARRLHALNQRAGFSALVRDEQGHLVLAASFLASEKNVPWTLRMLPAVAALQAAEAGPVAAALAAVGATPLVSAHPDQGMRARSQAELGALASRVFAQKAAPPLDPRIYADVAATLRDVGLTARADGRGLDVEMPFAGETALLQLLGPLDHPGIGKGVLCVLVLPVLALRHALEGEGLPALLARLNAQARHHGFHAESLPALGGWAPDPNSGHPSLAAFVPAPLAHDEVLTDLVMAQLARALLLARCFDSAVEAPEALARSLADAI